MNACFQFPSLPNVWKSLQWSHRGQVHLKNKKQFAIFFLFFSSTDTFWGPISASFVRCPFSCGSCSWAQWAPGYGYSLRLPCVLHHCRVTVVFGFVPVGLTNRPQASTLVCGDFVHHGYDSLSVIFKAIVRFCFQHPLDLREFSLFSRLQHTKLCCIAMEVSIVFPILWPLPEISLPILFLLSI